MPTQSTEATGEQPIDDLLVHNLRDMTPFDGWRRKLSEEEEERIVAQIAEELDRWEPMNPDIWEVITARQNRLMLAGDNRNLAFITAYASICAYVGEHGIRHH